MNAVLELPLLIDQDFSSFLNDEVLPMTKLDATEFWKGFVGLVEDLTPSNRSLLADRDQLQSQIDQWHRSHRGDSFNMLAYDQFLRDIGYIVDEGPDFAITTANVDSEIAEIAGPQLVVPVQNARFALNAANARWGSLYDAIYGTNVIPKTGQLQPGEKYNKIRGYRVIAYARDFLDEYFPLAKGSHHQARAYRVSNERLLVSLADGTSAELKQSGKFVAYTGTTRQPSCVVLKNNGLHVVIDIDRQGRIGADDSAGINDIQIESALTTIMDCEDSVAAVDTADKLEVYRNWLGLIRGILTATFNKNGRSTTRKLNRDRIFTTPSGANYRLSGRSLMLIRNVGHHMNCELMATRDGQPVPEGLIDAVVTALIASLDLNPDNPVTNSRCGSIYIVKPKMHGPEEVRFTCALFSRVEDLLELPRNTLKMGIMDEERRTTVNLKACVREAKERVFFVNTGFLDRTGDEIHTSMQAGPFLPKANLKEAPWIRAYEDLNVDVGLACGFQGRAQIGKGMWAMPDEMAEMMEKKIGHPRSGASTAWVPSPTAATLHALHYHKVDVQAVQDGLRNRRPALLTELLTMPIMEDLSLSPEEIEQELENNLQGILGYVVRWIDQGIGCSKVPDINNIGLMEDRATLRISSQHIANWLEHGICNREQVLAVMQKMASVVDKQNAGDTNYQKIAPNTEKSLAYQAAWALVFEGVKQPNGYTEPLLHQYRRRAKSVLHQSN